MTRVPEDHETDADDLVRIGRVKSVDHAAARCVVEIEDGAETHDIRWLAPRMGATRVWSAPAVGEQVVLLCPAGELAGAVALGGLVSDSFPAPAATAMDLVRFSDGAILSYDPGTGQLAMTLPAGGTVAITAPGGVTITGDVDVTGTITATTDVVADGISLVSHTHSGVQSGGSSTGGPE